MEGKNRARNQFDITIARASWRWAAGVLALAVAAGGAAVHAQSLDSTLDEIVDAELDEQIEDQIAEELESTVEQQVEDEVADAVQQQVESGVTAAVEDEVQENVATLVEQQVVAGVAATVEQAVESGVLGAVEETLEQGLEGISDLSETVGDAVDRATDGAADTPAGETGPRANERFAGAFDDLNRAIERDVWVVLVPAAYAARIERWGFTIRERRDLGTLARVLLRVDAPADRDIVQAALELALDAPGTLVDFNHVYRGGAGDDGARIAALPSAEPGPPTPRALAIGVVDSAVASDHEALRAADIVQHDFVPFDAARPLLHGTAVASILVGDSKAFRGRVAGARLYAASVFFADDAGEPAATTASLVAALEWLAAENVPAINMSLAGPPNRVLEAAITAVAEHGAVIVAAVGNDGPAGEPLYPAAYDSVVGVTAVDSARRIYRYANRGGQVSFAAPGVRVRVARSDGGYAAQSGTSIAAPYAAAIIAQSLAARRTQTPAAVLSALEAAAIDLGEKDFDEVYGFGLIAPVE